MKKQTKLLLTTLKTNFELDKNSKVIFLGESKCGSIQYAIMWLGCVQFILSVYLRGEYGFKEEPERLYLHNIHPMGGFVSSYQVGKFENAINAVNDLLDKEEKGE